MLVTQYMNSAVNYESQTSCNLPCVFRVDFEDEAVVVDVWANALRAIEEKEVVVTVVIGM